jgi:hypothetical protein
MRTFTAGFLVVACVCVGSVSAAHNTEARWLNDNHFDCSALEVTFDGAAAARAEQQLTVATSSGPLDIVAPRHGGIHMRGADRPDVLIRVCKAAPADASDKRTDVLSRIAGRASGGSVRVEGPTDADWVAYLLVDVPAGASASLATANGPIEVRDFSGSVRAKTTNGPVHLLNVSGTVTAQAQNGPIGFIGQTGTVDLTAQNGPIQVGLKGTKWERGELTARTQNGPLQLDVPESYRSTVHLETSEHTPFSCKGTACDTARKTWDTGSRSLELGEGPTAVRLSTVNGPVQVRSGK